MIYTFFEDVLVRQGLDPDTYNNQTLDTAWIPVSDVERLAFLLSVGATDTTVDMKVRQAQDANGTNAKDVTGAAITQIDATGDNTQAGIEVRSQALDRNNGYSYVSAQVVVGNGTTGADLSLVVLGANPIHRPVTQPTGLAEWVIVT